MQLDRRLRRRTFYILYYIILYNSNLYNCFGFTNVRFVDPAYPALVATPLPSNPFTGQPHPHQAHQKCLDLESLAPTNLALQGASPPGLVAARLLGYLLVHSEDGRPKLAREIITHPTTKHSLVWRSIISPILSKFARLYNTTSPGDIITVLPVKHASGRTPAPSEHPSQPSFDAEREALASIDDARSLDYRKAKRAVRTSPFL